MSSIIDFLEYALKNKLPVNYSKETGDGTYDVLRFVIEELEFDENYVEIYSSAGTHRIKINECKFDETEKAYIIDNNEYITEVWGE